MPARRNTNTHHIATCNEPRYSLNTVTAMENPLPAADLFDFGHHHGPREAEFTPHSKEP